MDLVNLHPVGPIRNTKLECNWVYGKCLIHTGGFGRNEQMRSPGAYVSECPIQPTNSVSDECRDGSQLSECDGYRIPSEAEDESGSSRLTG